RGLAAPAPEERAATDDVVEVATPLFVGAEGRDEPEHGRVHVERHRRARAPPGDGADHGDVGRHIELETAVRPRHRGGEESLAPEITPTVDGVDRVAVVGGGAGRDLLSRQPRGAFDDRSIYGHWWNSLGGTVRGADLRS